METDEELKKNSLLTQLDLSRRRLYKLQEKVAGFGIQYSPPHFEIDIEETQKEIADLETQLANLPSIQTSTSLIKDWFQSYVIMLEDEFLKFGHTKSLITLQSKPGKQGWNNIPKAIKFDVRRLENLLYPSYSSEPPSAILSPNEKLPLISVEEFLVKHERITLLGLPGAGKSTTLRRLFQEKGLEFLNICASQADQVQLNNTFIPFYIVLNRWQDEDLELVEFLQEQIHSYEPNLANIVPTLIKQGKVLLILDGLNEVPLLKRDEKTGLIIDKRVKAIERITEKWPRVWCVLSCRVKDFMGGPEWKDLHILSLTKEQVQNFAQACYEDVIITERFVTALYRDGQEKLQTLVTQPFYLRRLITYFYRLGDIPKSPALLLKFSVEEMLETEIEKGLLTYDQIKELQKRLGFLAFNMTDARQVGGISHKQAAAWLFHIREVHHYSPDYLEPVASSEEIKLSEKWLRLAENCLIITSSANGIQFHHQLLQEYFCALHWQTQKLTDDSLYRTTLSGFGEVWQMWGGLEENGDGSNHLIDQLINILQPNNLLLSRWRAALALGEIKDERAVEPLIKALKSSDPDLREHAARALGDIGDPKAIVPLVENLVNKNGQSVGATSTALSEIGKPAVNLLISNLKDTSSEVRQKIATTLGQIKDERAVEPLCNLLEDSDSEVRESAARALSWIKDSRGILPLIKALQDVESKVRSSAASSLGVFRDKRTFTPLINALKDKDSNVRFSAALSLSTHENIRAMKPLLKALKDEDSWVRFIAASALGKIGDESVIPSLKWMAANDEGTFFEGDKVADAAKDAILKIFERINIKNL